MGFVGVMMAFSPFGFGGVGGLIPPFGFAPAALPTGGCNNDLYKEKWAPPRSYYSADDFYMSQADRKEKRDVFYNFFLFTIAFSIAVGFLHSRRDVPIKISRANHGREKLKHDSRQLHERLTTTAKGRRLREEIAKQRILIKDPNITNEEREEACNELSKLLYTHENGLGLSPRDPILYFKPSSWFWHPFEQSGEVQEIQNAHKALQKINHGKRESNKLRKLRK
jgi:hypothetical protein